MSIENPIDLSKPFFTSPYLSQTRGERMEEFAIEWISNIVYGYKPSNGDMRSRLYNMSNPPSMDERHEKGFSLYNRETITEDDFKDDLVPDIDDITGEEYYYWREQERLESPGFFVTVSQNKSSSTGKLVPLPQVCKQFNLITRSLEDVTHTSDLNLSEKDLARLHGIAANDHDRVRKNTHYDLHPTGDGSMICRPSDPNAQNRMKNHDFGAGEHGPLMLGDLPLITYPNTYKLVDSVPSPIITSPELRFKTDDELDEMAESGELVYRDLAVKNVRLNGVDAVESKKGPRNLNRPWSEVMNCTHWDLTSSKYTNPFITVDIDQPDAVEIYRKTVDDGLVPEASYVIVNRDNGHAQFFYIIPAVDRNDPAQLNLYKMIKSTLVVMLNGDLYETGRRCRNPYYIRCNDRVNPDMRNRKTTFDGDDDLEVRVPDAAKTGGCRIWSLYGLKDFLTKSGATGKYGEYRRKMVKGRALTGMYQGSIDDGRRTALDPFCVMGETIPCGLRNSVTNRVVNYHIWHEKMLDEDKIVEKVMVELDYEQPEGDLFGEAQIRPVVKSALRNHKRRYNPCLDPSSPLYRTNLKVKDGKCVDKSTGKVVCGLEELKSKGVSNIPGIVVGDTIAMRNGRKGGSKHSEAQQSQRSMNLRNGVKAKIEAQDRNREAVMRAIKSVDATSDDDLVMVKADGRKVKISRKAAVWHRVEADSSVKMSRRTCDRHYDELIRVKSEEAVKLHDDVNGKILGRRGDVLLKDTKGAKSSVVLLQNLSGFAMGPLVTELRSRGYAPAAVDVLDAVINMEEFVLAACGKVDHKNKTPEVGEDMRRMGRLFRDVFYTEGLWRMRNLDCGREWDKRFSGVVRLPDGKHRTINWWSEHGSSKPLVDWVDDSSVREWAESMSAGSNEVLNELGRIGWFREVLGKSGSGDDGRDGRSAESECLTA